MCVHVRIQFRFRIKKLTELPKLCTVLIDITASVAIEVADSMAARSFVWDCCDIMPSSQILPTICEDKKSNPHFVTKSNNI